MSGGSPETRRVCVCACTPSGHACCLITHTHETRPERTWHVLDVRTATVAPGRSSSFTHACGDVDMKTRSLAIEAEWRAALPPSLTTRHNNCVHPDVKNPLRLIFQKGPAASP